LEKGIKTEKEGGPSLCSNLFWAIGKGKIRGGSRGFSQEPGVLHKGKRGGGKKHLGKTRLFFVVGEGRKNLPRGNFAEKKKKNSVGSPLGGRIIRPFVGKSEKRRGKRRNLKEKEKLLKKGKKAVDKDPCKGKNSEKKKKKKKKGGGEKRVGIRQGSRT